MPQFRNLGFLGFPRYEVGDDGSVWSLNKKTRRTLRQWINRAGYHVVTLKDSGRKKHFLVNRLVLLAFVGPCPEGHETRHLNRTPSDNRLDNLAWGTTKENAADRARHGTLLRGETVGNSKLNETDVQAIRAAYMAGESQPSIAAKYGISQQNISMLIRVTWKHVDASVDAKAIDERTRLGRANKGTSHGMAKINDEEVQRIRQLYAGGDYSQQSLADMFHIDQTTVSRIVRGKDWKHLPQNK